MSYVFKTLDSVFSLPIVPVLARKIDHLGVRISQSWDNFRELYSVVTLCGVY